MTAKFEKLKEMIDTNKRLIQIAVILILIPMFSCWQIDRNDVREVEHSKFTSDELSYLYFEKDTLDYNWYPSDYYGTISFLYNSTDTIFVQVYTSISSFNLPYTSSRSIYGYSMIDFDNQFGFISAHVDATKDVPGTDANIDISFSIADAEKTYISLDFKIDTALVLGKTYNNVYKTEYPENSPTKLKKIFFAKIYGFIKIETADGRKLERLDL